jgi:hypothetical protein
MAGTTNFLQFNPGANNQETDSAYLADSQRSSGAIDGQEFPSILANKAFYQWSTFIAAFAAALANKNYSTSDANIATLESVLANIVTFADLKSNLTSVSFSTTPVFNATSTNGFDFVLAANVTSSTLTGQQIGQTLTFVIKQGATAYTFVPPTNINGWQPVSTVPNSVTTQSFIVRQDGTIWPVDNATPPFLLGVNGYVKLPIGLLVQWGYLAQTNGNYSFPTPFPTACVNLQACRSNANSGSAADTPIMAINSNTSFYLATVSSLNGNRAGFPCWWFAIGY